MDACAAKYRDAREALIALEGPAAGEKFRELRPQDVQLDGDAGESDAAARKKLAMLSAGRGERAPRNAPGTSKKLMSWIWTAPGALDDEEGRIHECELLSPSVRSLLMSFLPAVRVEWARARARKVRWEEEVMTLREEMRRVMRYLVWQARWWRECAALRPDVSREVAAGIRAYAMKQADLHTRLGMFFEKKWNIPALAAAQRLVALDMEAEEDGPELDQFFSQHE